MHSRVVTRQFSKKTTSTSTPPERSSLGAHQFKICANFVTLIAWYNPRIPGLPLNRQEKEQVVFSEDGPGVSKMSLAPVQPRLLHRCNPKVAPVQETFSRLSGPPPKRLLAPSPVDLGAIQEFGGCTRQSGSQNSHLKCKFVRSEGM